MEVDSKHTRLKKLTATRRVLGRNTPRASMIFAMAAPRGRAHRGRTGAFNPETPIKAASVLYPGEEVRIAYEELVREMGVSGSEVIRQAILTLRQHRAAQSPQEARQIHLQEAV